jgi:hypothetical protein
MKAFISILSLSLSVLIILTVLRPSNQAMLAEGLPKGQDAILKYPPTGTLIPLPKKDIYGRLIASVGRRLVVIMPHCQSCGMRHVNWTSVRQVSKNTPILVFPEMPTKSVALAKKNGFFLLVEPNPPLVSINLHDFGPNAMWLDSSNRIKSFDRSVVMQ